MAIESVNKATANLVKAIGEAAQARVNAEAHKRDRDSFEWHRDHRRACQTAAQALEVAIESSAEHLRQERTNSPRVSD